PIFKLLNKIGDFRLGKRVFQGYNYRPCCGNVYWDYVEVSPRTAAELLNHLKRMGKWQWHVAAVAFDLIWSSPVRDFRAEDFKTDVFRA
ncbi:MAG: hypothetical protein K8I00_02300, partial [Candidatus Omnitrophica bacterium]|nr:hypothetical protein [Candidatus Omnitrophota bacterium]